MHVGLCFGGTRRPLVCPAGGKDGWCLMDPSFKELGAATPSRNLGGFPVAQTVKNSLAMLETQVQSLGLQHGNPLQYGNSLQYSSQENPHGQRNLEGYSS